MVLPFAVPEILAQETPTANPASVLITPRQGQSTSQQIADQNECFDWTCELIDWDPYRGYQALVEKGYTRALDRAEMLKELEELALTGAIAGEIAGEMLEHRADQPGPEEPVDISPSDGEAGADHANAAAMGAVMALAWAQGWLDLDLLLEPADPQARRAINRYERNLRKWETKYSSCLKRKGYRVSSP